MDKGAIDNEHTVITFKEALLYWLKLGFISFGGPTGQIAMMYKELVERRKWISESHFLQALNFCMLLPGPEAQQLCIYIGWLMHKTWGGIVAGTLFVLPAVFILLLLSWLYTEMGTLPAVAGMLYGLKPAVVAIVAEALLRIGKKALKNVFFYRNSPLVPHLHNVPLCAISCDSVFCGNNWICRKPVCA